MEKNALNRIKRGLNRVNCDISKIAGCYVNSSKEKMISFNEDFIGLTDEEIYLYLDIARKSVSGVIGKKLKEIVFSEECLDMQKRLHEMKESKLSDLDILEDFYDQIISFFEYPGHYFILLFYDSYDVPQKGSKGIDLLYLSGGAF